MRLGGNREVWRWSRGGKKSRGVEKGGSKYIIMEVENAGVRKGGREARVEQRKMEYV